MSKMEYGKVGLEVLVNEEYLGHEYLILNLHGRYPTAYVRLKDNEILNHYDDYEIEVHGGLTFLGVPATKNCGTWIGWDYAHFDDYTCFIKELALFDDMTGKKWATEEIIEEAKSVIEQLIEMFKK